MATSGTAIFNPVIVEIIQEAMERCGLDLRSGYEITTARRSFNLLMVSFSNMQLNMWCEEPQSIPLAQGTTSYELDPDTVDVIMGAIRLNAGNATLQQDLVISRTSMQDYAAIPNKLIQGQPTQFAVERLTDAPVVYFYPTPDGSQSYSFYHRRLRRPQDAGNQARFTADVPFRYLEAVTAGLAYMIASKTKAAFSEVPRLKLAYDEALLLAQDEDRDRASIMLVPYANQRY